MGSYAIEQHGIVLTRIKRIPWPGEPTRSGNVRVSFAPRDLVRVNLAGRHPSAGTDDFGHDTQYSRLQRIVTLINLLIWLVNERRGGIRALPCPVRSVSYRFQIAMVPTVARFTVDPCTLLHAGP